MARWSRYPSQYILTTHFSFQKWSKYSGDIFVALYSDHYPYHLISQLGRWSKYSRDIFVSLLPAGTPDPIARGALVIIQLTRQATKTQCATGFDHHTIMLVLKKNHLLHELIEASGEDGESFVCSTNTTSLQVLVTMVIMMTILTIEMVMFLITGLIVMKMVMVNTGDDLQKLAHINDRLTAEDVILFAKLKQATERKSNQKSKYRKVFTLYTLQDR